MRHYAFSSLVYVTRRRREAGTQIESTVVRRGLKSATDGWVGLGSTGFACLHPVWPRVSCTDSAIPTPASLGTGFFRRVFLISRASLAETVLPARHRPNLKRAVGREGTSARKRVEKGETSDNPPSLPSPLLSPVRSLRAGKSRMTK